ncbi:MAG: UbiA prenyltransferase family protein [Acidobacteria bacterium]|nr:UbiA prenyltransferase family protein [Acidobacteriota bacterium]
MNEAGAHRKTGVEALVRLLRVPEWTKNLFVLAPLFFSDSFTELSQVGRAAAAFGVFCLVASFVYVVNDWFDREEDARHPTKRDRPIASGRVDGRQAAVVGILLLLGAAALGLVAGLGGGFWVVIGAYLAINVAYSTFLRHVDLVDVCIVAAGFVLRVLAGSQAIDVPASPWIILSTGLLALLLALGKRRVDLSLEDADRRRSLAGYSVEFIDIALATLAASVIGFYALFTLSDYTLEKFGTGDLYLTTFFVVIGVLRYLQVVIGYQRQASPTSIALKDRPMQAMIVGWLASFALIAFT